MKHHPCSANTYINISTFMHSPTFVCVFEIVSSESPTPAPSMAPTLMPSMAPSGLSLSYICYPTSFSLHDIAPATALGKTMALNDICISMYAYIHIINIVDIYLGIGTHTPYIHTSMHRCLLFMQPKRYPSN